MDNKLYWIWLQQCLGYGYKVKKAVNYFTDAKSIYESGETEKIASKVFSHSPNSKMQKILTAMNNKSLEDSQNILDTCQKHGLHVLTPDDELYPDELRELEDFPCVIYARGDVSCLNSGMKIAIVGTRNPSDYGVESASIIIRGIAKNEITIVSGGAIGVDSLAHNGAMDNGVKTILVMGCGHGTKYLPQNAELRKKVSHNGVLITEYPPFEKVDYNTFPLRNRLISALGKGLVIIEAAEKSGTLNTARHAKNQGKEIFVLPGDIKSRNYTGSNKLIIDGAKPIFSAKDILDHFDIEAKFIDDSIGTASPFEGVDSVKPVKKTRKPRNKKVAESKEKNKAPIEQEIIEPKPEISLDSVSNNGKLVYNIIKNGVYQLDEITRKVELPINKVLVSLTELELLGLVVSLGANKYSLK